MLQIGKCGLTILDFRKRNSLTVYVEIATKDSFLTTAGLEQAYLNHPLSNSDYDELCMEECRTQRCVQVGEASWGGIS